MYREVAEHRQGEFHFELGEKVATRAGYDPDRIAALPPEAGESFAGYFFDLAALEPGETVGRPGQRDPGWTHCTPQGWSAGPAR